MGNGSYLTWKISKVAPNRELKKKVSLEENKWWEKGFRDT